MGKLFNRLVRDEGGNVLMLSAAALIPLLILVGGVQKYLLVGMTFGTVRNEI